MATFWLQKYYEQSGLCGQIIIEHTKTALIIHFNCNRTIIKDEFE